VVVDDNVLAAVAEDDVGLLGRPTRDGLLSCRLFFRDLVPGLVDEARETFVRERGRVGDGSRETSGDGAAEEEVEAPEACETSLDGQESVLGVMVAVLAVDSRDKVVGSGG